MSKLIADVSKHQGTIDFGKMRKAGVDSVIIRAGYRSAKAGELATDPNFAENIRNAEKAGLHVGLYWWTTAKSVKEAEAEADYCVALARNHKLSFPIWLDLEHYRSDRSGRADHLSAQARTSYATMFLERCRELGYDAGVYCNPDFWKNDLVPHVLERYPRWIAHYDAKSAGMACDIWQYTSTAKGSTYGAGSAYIDLNRMYTDFPAGEKSLFATDKTVHGKSDGNPDPAPTVTVTSTERAAEKHLERWVPQGDMVRWVQWELHRLGYDLGAAGVDGVCGAKTVRAIETFQMESGLTVDGLCGPKTRDALKAAKERPAVSIKEEPDYKSRVAFKAEKIYPLCVGRKHGSGVQKTVKNLARFKGQKQLNCHLMVSLVLQEAGLLPKDCIIEHTKKADGKKKITDAVRGTENLRHCKVYWVNKLYGDLPEEWKKPGIVYIQNSNACISAGGGYIWSCNKSVNEEYKNKADYLKNTGYVVKSRILAVLVPD